MLSRDLAKLENERVQVAKSDQIRRLSASIRGGKPESVTDEQASFTALIWFGSLGALAALAGPLTAIAALGLQRTAEMRDQAPARPLSTYLRRWLINWRFRRTKKVTVERVVEVPVEKIVEKLVEVQVEKVIKEILYIPILTDDPEAIKAALKDGLPDQIGELVSLKYKSNRGT